MSLLSSCLLSYDQSGKKQIANDHIVTPITGLVFNPVTDPIIKVHPPI